MVAVHPSQGRRIEKARVEIAVYERCIDFSEGTLQCTGIVARDVHALGIASCRLDITPPGSVEVNCNEKATKQRHFSRGIPRRAR
jgi:hypothetical protein